MKKISIFIVAFIFFFTLLDNVSAARGDLIYNVKSVNLSDNGITITGYAFIHRTKNYVTI